MASSARDRTDRIDSFLCGKQQFPFDWVNLPMFYDPEPMPGTEYYDRLTDGMKLANFVADEMSYGLRFAFRASAMSNGTRAYDLVDDCTQTQMNNILTYGQSRFGRPVKTTQNIKSTVAGSEVLNRVILPNRETDYRAGNVMESAFPDYAAVYPIIFENAIRTQKSNAAQSQGATPQDWTFEYWWVPRVMRMSLKLYDGEQRYESRYLCIEDMAGDMIQAGAADNVPYRNDVGPGKEFPVVDVKNRDVPLADRAWGRAKHVFHRTEGNFATDLAIATLLGEFALDDWLRGNGQPVGFDPIDPKKLHKTLANRSAAELERMDRLKAIMLPYIADKCLDFIPWQRDPNLKKYVEDKVLPEAGKSKILNMAEVRKALFSETIIGDQNNLDIKKPGRKRSGVSAKFETAGFLSKPAKRRDTDGGYFAKGSRLFEDDHYSKLSIWEQAGLPFVLSAMESYRLPESAPRSLFYIAEPKGGARARAFMADHKIDFLKEAYSVEEAGDSGSFVNKVIQPNRRQTYTDVDKIAVSDIAKSRGIKNIVSTNNMIDIAAGMERYRKFVASEGPEKLSPRGRLAMMLQWMDRNPEAVAVRKDWHVHHDESQLVLRALQIALGLVDRPYNGGNYRMEIFSMDEQSGALAKQDLYDLIMPLAKTVEQMLNAAPAPEAREHYLTLARMIQILDMYKDPGRTNYTYHTDEKTGAIHREEIIHWREADAHLMSFWHDDPKKQEELVKVCNRLRQKLLDVGVLHFEEKDLDGLGDDFRAAWQNVHGLDEASRRRKFDGRRTGQKWNGPA